LSAWEEEKHEFFEERGREVREGRRGGQRSASRDTIGGIRGKRGKGYQNI